MKKIKFSNRKIALAALFIVSGSLAHAAPSSEDADVEALMDWLLATQQRSEPVVCNDFPYCPPDFAPQQEPSEKEKKDKK